MNAQTQQVLQDSVVILPISVLFLVSLIPILIKVFRGNREPQPFSTLLYGFIGLVFATGITAAMAGGQKTAFSLAIVLDDVSVWSSCLVYFITAIVLMLSYDHAATKGKQFSEFCFLLISSAIGMVILIMSNDLIVTFLGIEMMSLALYILVAMSKEETLAKEAAFKYFILGSFASAIFLYGIALIYGTAGTTYLIGNESTVGLVQNAGRLISTNRIFLVGLGFVTLGFSFKVALFPFHAWAPDVYQGAPTPITAFMATAVKAATFVAFIRLFHCQGLASSAAFMNAMSWIAVLTMVLGNAAAIMQDNVKRMLAYSSVAHSGYAMVGLIAAGFGSDFNASASSVLFYLFSYSFMTMGSFALVGLLEKEAGTIIRMDDLKGLARRHPVLALSFTILMLSLAGIPPTLGFFGKLYIFSAAIEQDMYWLAFWGVLSSAISVYYYLRPVVMMYMSEEEGAEIVHANIMTRFTVIAAALIIVVVGIFSSPAIRAIRSAFNLL